jgi:hypothetical protein
VASSIASLAFFAGPSLDEETTSFLITFDVAAELANAASRRH